jgi:hypothetical protein
LEIETKPSSLLIHLTGAFLFLFIPLVLFLFLRYPFGIRWSFAIAILVMFSHRLVAIPFMNKYRSRRCFWCGRTARPRLGLEVDAGKPLGFELCKDGCFSQAKRFFEFCERHKRKLRATIFLPLLWYIGSMLLVSFSIFSFPADWNNFIFRFFIACTVVAISFLYQTGKETENPRFPFPIHNLFLLGARNTLWVFRIVGIWWILAGMYFLSLKSGFVG